MKWVPVPGFGAGVLEKQGNFAQYVDSLFLNGHMYQETKTWDPEGIVSTLPAIATTLFGILTGHLLRMNKRPEEKTAWMFFSGNVLIVAGLILNFWLPINKNLWTTSYSVFMAGMALSVFSWCYWIIDVKGYRAWARPFAIYGMNAIAVYVLAGVIARSLLYIYVTAGDSTRINLKDYIFQSVFLPLASPINASLIYGLAFSFLLFIVSWIMYRRKWIIKI